MTTEIATAQKPSLLAKFATRYNVDAGKMLDTLKATAFKGNVSNEQMIALLIVADQYNLNPFTKEIYAFPDKGGIVPVVGVDGWMRLMNEHPQFDGIDFEQDDESCTCIIYRKDRSHPVRTTEYMDECKRDTQPWNSHPRRMLRHKALIQCARIAFGFAGIYDQDEAERIVEKDITPQPARGAAKVAAIKQMLKRPEAEPESIDQQTGEVIEAIKQQPDIDDDFLRGLEQGSAA